MRDACARSVMGGKLAKAKTFTVLFTGLDNSGKTTILSWKSRSTSEVHDDGKSDR